jgi:hypothetical protein
VTTEQATRCAALALMALGFGLGTWDAARGFYDDFGWPWRKRRGTNGRWRTDLLVVVLFGSITVISVIAVLALVFDGWRWHRPLVTALLAVVGVVAVGLWASARHERRKDR